MWGQIIIFGSILSSSFGCNVPIGHKELSLEERVEKFDIVVYGRDAAHVKRMGFTDSIFEVFCVIKGDHNIVGNITIQEILPKTACSGTYIYYLKKFKGNISPGLELIIGLKRRGNGNYIWHEINILESAFDPTNETWDRIAKVIPAKNWIDSNQFDEGCPLRFSIQSSEAEPEYESTPEPGKSTLGPEGSTPEPGESTPEPGESTPEPGGSTPEPGESTPEPEESTPGSEQATPKAQSQGFGGNFGCCQIPSMFTVIFIVSLSQTISLLG